MSICTKEYKDWSNAYEKNCIEIDQHAVKLNEVKLFLMEQIQETVIELADGAIITNESILGLIELYCKTYRLWTEYAIYYDKELNTANELTTNEHWT